METILKNTGSLNICVCKYIVAVFVLLSLPLKERLFHSPLLMEDWESEGLTFFRVFEQPCVRLRKWFAVVPDKVLTF